MFGFIFALLGVYTPPVISGGGGGGGGPGSPMGLLLALTKAS